MLFGAFADIFFGQIAHPQRGKRGPQRPCPCGSGKKYKNCHGRLEAAE